EDADELVSHPGVVVDAQGAARERVAVESDLVGEHQHEWERDTEDPDADAHPEVGADVEGCVLLGVGVWARSDVAERPEQGGCHAPEPTARAAMSQRPTQRGRQRVCCRPRCDSADQPVQPAIVPGGSQLSGVLPVTAVFDSVTVPPELKMPPPWAAMLPVTWLLC